MCFVYKTTVIKGTDYHQWSRYCSIVAVMSNGLKLIWKGVYTWLSLGIFDYLLTPWLHFIFYLVCRNRLVVFISNVTVDLLICILILSPIPLQPQNTEFRKGRLKTLTSKRAIQHRHSQLHLPLPSFIIVQVAAGMTKTNTNLKVKGQKVMLKMSNNPTINPCI